MKFGISILSIVPMRSEISDKSEMVSQILFGEIYKIIEQRKKFSCLLTFCIEFTKTRIIKNLKFP